MTRPSRIATESTSCFDESDETETGDDDKGRRQIGDLADLVDDYRTDTEDNRGRSGQPTYDSPATPFRRDQAGDDGDRESNRRHPDIVTLHGVNILRRGIDP